MSVVIGLAFGWCLERGGLGDAPRLAGQFYLTDLRVFKIMFSALVTAMLGAFWIDHTAVAPETFLLPQAVGGALFGVGFLVAGLCPGTSCVAAASGSLDGLGVIGGMLAGVALFDAGLPWTRHFYKSTASGVWTLPQATGMSQGMTVAVVTFIALGAFALAERFERSRA